MTDLSPRELYRRECAEIVSKDQRWTKHDSGDDCVVCGAYISWRDPKGQPRCPMCWDWASDPLAPAIPLNPIPTSGIKRSLSPMPCDACDFVGQPILEWQWTNEDNSRLAIGAYCVSCRTWIKWLPIKTHEEYAPPRPPVGVGVADQLLFDLESEGRHSGYSDTSAGNLAKSTKGALPPAPIEKPVSLYYLPKAWASILASNGMLYLNEDGNICCTRPWNMLKSADAIAIKRRAHIVKQAMIEDVHWQIRASQRSPHVIHVHHQDRARLAVIAAWESAGRPAMTGTTGDRVLPDIPEFPISTVVQMEREVMGGYSHTAMALAEHEKNQLHCDAKPFLTGTNGGGLF